MNNLYDHKEIDYNSKSKWTHSHPIFSLNGSHSHRKTIELNSRYKHNNSLDCDKREIDKNRFIGVRKEG